MLARLQRHPVSIKTSHGVYLHITAPKCRVFFPDLVGSLDLRGVGVLLKRIYPPGRRQEVDQALKNCTSLDEVTQYCRAVHGFELRYVVQQKVCGMHGVPQHCGPQQRRP